jgi:outer membrane lipoprotein carrier protein
MRKTVLSAVGAIFLLLSTAAVAEDEARTNEAPAAADLGDERVTAIVEKIEARYAVGGFTASFVQASTLKAMEITDTATGRLWAKHPAKMRWEYDSPERQTIVTDGKELWIYRPDDNQVMIGGAPILFEGGKGAGFLADMQSLRERFDISLGESEIEGYHLLRLVPRKKTPDLVLVRLYVLDTTYDVVEVVTTNVYGDETRIRMDDIRFQQSIDDTLFEFDIPPGVDILRLDEQP